MLKKLLKYDFQSVFKYWWIAAISSLILSGVGGLCFSLLTSERKLPQSLYPVIIFALILMIIGFVVFCLSSYLFVFIRFYKNFFTDEGYLTFTLPVTKAQLLNSKLIMSLVTLFITSVVFVLDILIVMVIGYSDIIFTSEFYQSVKEEFHYLWDNAGAYLILYGLESIVGFILLLAFSTLFLFCCITFASMICKKSKILIGIGIYYVANSIFSFIVRMFYVFGLKSLTNQLNTLPPDSILPILAWILLGIICFIAIFCALLYTYLHWMMDRKLNLD